MDGFCDATTKSGSPCRARPLTSSTKCLNHDERRAEARTAERRKGGQLTQARRALAKAKANAVQRFGITEPIPDLADIDACRRFLVAVAAKVLEGGISPAAANALSTIVRVSKELLSLEVDVKLSEKLDELEAKERRS